MSDLPSGFPADDFDDDDDYDEIDDWEGDDWDWDDDDDGGDLLRADDMDLNFLYD